MIRQPVSSSNIQSVGYDAESNTLEIEFKSGTIYQYFDVPQAVYQELLNASSMGQYFSSNIRSAYRFARV